MRCQDNRIRPITLNGSVSTMSGFVSTSRFNGSTCVSGILWGLLRLKHLVSLNIQLFVLFCFWVISLKKDNYTYINLHQLSYNKSMHSYKL